MATIINIDPNLATYYHGRRVKINATIIFNNKKCTIKNKKASILKYHNENEIIVKLRGHILSFKAEEIII